MFSRESVKICSSQPLPRALALHPWTCSVVTGVWHSWTHQALRDTALLSLGVWYPWTHWALRDIALLSLGVEHWETTSPTCPSPLGNGSLESRSSPTAASDVSWPITALFPLRSLTQLQLGGGFTVPPPDVLLCSCRKNQSWFHALCLGLPSLCHLRSHLLVLWVLAGRDEGISRAASPLWSQEHTPSVAGVSICGYQAAGT